MVHAVCFVEFQAPHVAHSCEVLPARYCQQLARTQRREDPALGYQRPRRGPPRAHCVPAPYPPRARSVPAPCPLLARPSPAGRGSAPHVRTTSAPPWHARLTPAPRLSHARPTPAPRPPHACPTPAPRRGPAAPASQIARRRRPACPPPHQARWLLFRAPHRAHRRTKYLGPSSPVKRSDQFRDRPEFGIWIEY